MYASRIFFELAEPVVFEGEDGILEGTKDYIP